MLKSTFLELRDGLSRQRIQGTLANGNAIDAVVEAEVDGRDAWWDKETSPCETGGVDPGDEDTGWDEVLVAMNDDEQANAAIEHALDE